MPSRSNRLTVTLDPDSIELLEALHKHTNLTPAAIVAKLFPSHLSELWEYRRWLEELSETPSKLRSVGVHLLHSYGPDDLVTAIKKIDPTYVTEEEHLTAKMNERARA
jgi:hypothetical protein